MATISSQSIFELTAKKNDRRVILKSLWGLLITREDEDCRSLAVDAQSS